MKMRLVLYLLAASAAAAIAEKSRDRRAELERTGRKVWQTSTGAALICGAAGDGVEQRDSSEQEPSLEVQLSGVLDAMCRYLEDVSSADVGSVQPSAQYDDIFAEISYDDDPVRTFTFTFTRGEGDHKSGHPALRPLHGPSAQPRQTSRSTEPLKSFRKL